ncbi:MAG: thioesterase family protein [Pseudomonadota bacterium]
MTDDYTFFHPLRVRWNECDAQGIVFNVNYFLYYDIAALEYFRALGYDREDMPEFVTARAEADFRGSAVFDDELRIGVRCARLGSKSATMEMIVMRGEELLNEGRLTYVAVAKGTTETMPLDEAYVARVLEFEKMRPEGR